MHEPSFDVDPDTALRQAMALHRRGAVSQAAEGYHRLLKQFPDQPQLLYLAGAAELQLGHAEVGIRLLGQSLQRQPKQPLALAYRSAGLLQLNRPAEALADCEHALALEPNSVDTHVNRGNALKALGRYAEALASYDRAIALNPQSVEAIFNRACLQNEMGRLFEALAGYDLTLSLSPRLVSAHVNRGNVLDALERFEEARSSFASALALVPQDVAALCGLCKVLCGLDRPEEALEAGETAVRLAPKRAEAYNNRGLARQKLRRLEEAMADYDRALALKPDLASAHNNRSSVLYELKRPQEALQYGLQAARLNPQSAEVHNNLGSIYRDLLRLDEARAAYDRAIALSPNHAVAHWNLALLDLLTGHFAEGWEGFEWRWKGPEMKRAVRNFSRPLWQGEPIEGKNLLLHAEQGLGDAVQFCRYAPLAAARGARVVLEVPRELLALLSTLPGDCTLVAAGQALPNFDLHCPLMSLPRAFHTALSTIPANVPYLAAALEKRAAWTERLKTKTKPRVGLVWAGRPGLSPDRIRSMTLAQLAPLMDLPCEFHALQKEIRPDDGAALARFPALQTHTDELGDFSDTAALIAEMDLVISVDTAVAHVAGAMGVPLWLLLPWTGEWRWLLDRSDSPWYPTATLMRQPGWGDWPGLVAAVAAKLQTTFF